MKCKYLRFAVFDDLTNLWVMYMYACVVIIYVRTIKTNWISQFGKYLIYFWVNIDIQRVLILFFPPKFVLRMAQKHTEL